MPIFLYKCIAKDKKTIYVQNVKPLNPRLYFLCPWADMPEKRDGPGACPPPHLQKIPSAEAWTTGIVAPGWSQPTPQANLFNPSNLSSLRWRCDPHHQRILPPFILQDKKTWIWHKTLSLSIWHSTHLGRGNINHSNARLLWKSPSPQKKNISFQPPSSKH